MIVACVLVGDGFDEKYVYNLRDAVARSLSLSHRFVCLSDRDLDGVETIRIDSGRSPKWWSKLHLFRNDLFEAGERLLYIDLDTVIPGNLDAIAQCDADFAMLSDFYHPDELASGMMSFRTGENEEIFTDWLGFGAPKPKKGDQWWIALHRPHATRLQDVFPDRIKSFKASVDIIDCDVLCFHGKPRPHECGGWVADVWNNRHKYTLQNKEMTACL